MNEFWFKPKTYGYGATPTTWEGWMLLAAYAVFIAVMSFVLIGRDLTFSAWIAWAAILIVVTVAMTWITRHKTDGPWHWRWGGENSRNLG